MWTHVFKESRLVIAQALKQNQNRISFSDVNKDRVEDPAGDVPGDDG